MSVQVSPPSVKEEDTCCDWSALRLSQCDIRSQHAIRSHTSVSPGELKTNTASQNFVVETKEEKTKQNPEIKLNLLCDNMSHTVLPLWTPQDTYLGVLWLKCTDFLWTLFYLSTTCCFECSFKSVGQVTHAQLSEDPFAALGYVLFRHRHSQNNPITINVWEDLYCPHWQI